ncbi:hypothetical protein K7G98_40100, partial [Saccharothrix sp. MB29]|nr:hypothetical protein [Saccharothrix sp. MB29]
EYLADDAPAALHQLGRVLAPGGLVSLLISNPDARVLKTAVVNRAPADALASFTRQTQPNRVFRARTRDYRPGDLMPAFAAAGLSPVQTYG